MLWCVQWEAPGAHEQGSAVTWFRFKRALWLLHGERVTREQKWKKEVEILVVFNHQLPKVPTWDDGTCAVATNRMVSHSGEKFWKGVGPILNSIWGPFGTFKTIMLHNSRGTLHTRCESQSCSTEAQYDSVKSTCWNCVTVSPGIFSLLQAYTLVTGGRQ